MQMASEFFKNSWWIQVGKVVLTYANNLILFSVRPLRIHWVSENVRTANEEIDRLDAEYADLKPCEVDHIHPGLKVKYNGLWSMLDGKLLQW